MKTIALFFLIFTSAVFAQKFLDVDGADGGLHDYIFRMPRETLTKWALATEKYHRKVNNLHLMGGLDDYIGRLSNQEIVNYILKEADEHPELNNKDKLEALTVEFGVKTEGHKRGGDGGLHDFIWREPREKLMTWALTTEAYHRDVKHQHLMGGLDDYVTTLSNDQIIDYIMNEVKEHPELASAEKLDSLSTKYNININSVHTPAKDSVAPPKFGGDGGLHDFIFRMPRETLNKWALATEKYHRKTNNVHLYGGLDDYIDTLSNEQVIDYIMNEVKEHPEIASSTKLDGLVSQYKITGVPHKVTAPVESGPIGGDGGLHDYIFRIERETLNTWALATEKYHRKVNNLHLMGGLDDYIHSLSKEQVIEYIMKETKEHPEIASGKKLDSLVSEYAIKNPINHGPLSSGPIGGDGGLHDYIWTLPRTKLEAYAFAFESYHNNNQPTLGGLHDYVNTLSNQQVIDYIMKEAKEHPEIANASKLDALVNGSSAPESKPLIGGGLHDVVRSLDRKNLISYALAMDEYSHEKSPRIGGIDDYVYKLNDSEIRNFILKQAETYPELNSKMAIEGLVKKYGITVRENN